MYNFKKGGSGIWPTIEFLSKQRNFGRDNDASYKNHFIGVAAELSVAIELNCMPDLQTYKKSGDGGVDLVVKNKNGDLLIAQIKTVGGSDKMFLLDSINEAALSPADIFICVRAEEILDEKEELRGVSCSILGFITKKEFLLKKQIDIFSKKEKPFIMIENLTSIKEL